MPLDEQHRERAESNERFADALEKSDSTSENWAVVAAFYAALHYTEQLFVRDGGPPCSDHKERLNRFKCDTRINSAYPSYKYLFELGYAARYKLYPLPILAYTKLAKPRLVTVKQQIDNVIAVAVASATKAAAARKAAFAPEPPKPSPGKPQT